MPRTALSLFAPLREAYNASRGVRSHDELISVLERLAGLISESLGWGTIVVNVHRRAWDDFEAAVVHGSDGAREALLGTAHTWAEWAPLFRDCHENRGAHFVPAGTDDGSTVVSFTPELPMSDDPGAWHP